MIRTCYLLVCKICVCVCTYVYLHIAHKAINIRQQDCAYVQPAANHFALRPVHSVLCNVLLQKANVL